jgi:hypothetical protein
MNLSKKKSCAVLLLTCALAPFAFARAVSAAETLKVQNVSKVYDLEVRVASCDGESRDEDSNRCIGPATVSLFRKGSKSPFQILRLPNVELYKDTAAFSPETSEKPRGLYAEEYSFVFDDFNFDGREDLAVCNGRDSGYGGPSYTVLLFDARAGKFVESRALSRLAEGEYLGLFFTDKKRRTLTAYSKGGCCYHETNVFSVVRNRPVLIEKVIEDATPWGGAPEGYVLITTKKKVRGRWVVRTKKEKLETETPDKEQNKNRPGTNL